MAVLFKQKWNHILRDIFFFYFEKQTTPRKELRQIGVEKQFLRTIVNRALVLTSPTTTTDSFW